MILAKHIGVTATLQLAVKISLGSLDVFVSKLVLWMIFVWCFTVIATAVVQGSLISSRSMDFVLFLVVVFFFSM